MAGRDYPPPRPWMQRKDSFSSLAGLEIAIPPGQQAPTSPPTSIYSEYSDKALPPIPLRSPQRSRFSHEEMEQDGLSSPTSKSSKKVLQLMGIHIDTDGMSKDPPRSQSRASRTSQKVFQLMGVHVDTDTSSKDPPRSQSRMSVSSSESGYSQDGLDDEYQAPSPARRSSSVENPGAIQKKGMFYLQAVTYSASAPKIDSSKSKSVPNQLNSEPISLRHKDRVQSAGPQGKDSSRNGQSKPPRPRSPKRSQTLDEMIAYERKRFDAEEFSRQMWKPTIGRPEPKTLHNKPRSPTQTKKENRTSPLGYSYNSAPTLAPPPLVFRGKASGREEHRQSISHFSDQSDDESPGMMANARDSVMSHIRRTVKSPSPTPSPHHALTFPSEKVRPFCTTKMMAPPTAPKRKRFSSKGKHPLKSPFPFQNSPKHKKPVWPPPGQHNTKSTTPSFSKRMSGVMRRFSTGSGSRSGSASGQGSQSPIPSSIITTESREANGPDTPMPPSTFPPLKKPSSAGNGANALAGAAANTNTRPATSSGVGIGSLVSNMTLTSPKFMKDKDGEKLMSPKEILEKGGMRFADAIESARKKAGVKSKAEKRREFIRANIVKIGQADQFPDGRVNRWL